MRRCSNCKKSFPKGRKTARFCPYCGAEQKPRRGKCVLLVAAVLALLAAAGAAVLLHDRPPEAHNVEEAIALLREQGWENGYQNAFSELTEQYTQEIGGDHLYRLQQNYEGIPVYGKSVTLVTDESGRQLAISENVLDIPEDISLTPAITPEQVAEAIRLYALQTWGVEDRMPTAEELEERRLYIWCSETDAEACLAYTVETGGNCFLVHAQTGGILDCVSLIRSAEADVVLEDSGETVRAWQLDDGSYQFADLGQNIYVCDARGETFVRSWIVTKMFYDQAQPVVSTNAVFGDGDDDPENSEQAIELYRAVMGVREYYQSVLGDDTLSAPMLLVANDQCGTLNGKQAFYAPITFSENDPYMLPGYDIDTQGTKLAAIILGTYYSSDPGEYLDIIAHECTHAVTKKLVGWTKEHRQTAAINEAFSDIFAELIEANLRGNRSPDWQISRRTLYDPAENGYPAYVGDSYIVSDYVLSAGTDYDHAYSTVISHAAWLMWNGIDGNRQKMLSNEELAELWYRAMVMLPADAEFIDCRTVVEMAAECMELTRQQRRCVSDAFERVLISNRETEDGYSYRVDGRFDLSVCDGNEDLYPDYTLVIREQKTGAAARMQANRQYTFDVTEAAPLNLRLAGGDYLFTVTDCADPSRQLSFEVCVDPLGNDSADEIVLITDFGEPSLQCLVYEVVDDGEGKLRVPVPHVTLSFFSHAYGKVYQTVDTGDYGDAVCVSVPAGSYTVWADAEGYSETEHTVTLADGDRQRLEICLQRTEAAILPEEEPPLEEETTEQETEAGETAEPSIPETEMPWEQPEADLDEQQTQWEPEQSAQEPVEYEMKELGAIYLLEDGTRKRISSSYVVLKSDDPVCLRLNERFLREAESFMEKKTENQPGVLQPYVPDEIVDEADVMMSVVGFQENGVLCVMSACVSGNTEQLDLRMEVHSATYDLKTGREVLLHQLLKRDRAQLAQELRDIVWAAVSEDEQLRGDARQRVDSWNPEDYDYYIDRREIWLVFPEGFLWNSTTGSDRVVPTGIYVP